jgi:hypothetical protein
MNNYLGMKKNICTLLLCGVAVAAGAASPKKYSEVFEHLKTLRDPEAIQVLFQYQGATTSRDFVNVNGYYLLGVLSQRMMRTYDPFMQAGNVRKSASDAKTYLGLALYYLTEKEAKKNGEYYTPHVAQPTLEAIKEDIAKRQKDVASFLHYFTQNQRYLNDGIRQYNACLDFFGRINQQNSRLYDLYFLADNELLGNLNELEQNFNAVIANLDSLKTSLEAYGMNSYRINYRLEPVQIHRLHGLTPANFLAAGAQVWDYASWVKDFRQMLSTDVAYLYREAAAINDTASLYIGRLKNKNISDVPSEYTLNPLVINKIYRYDVNTAVAPLLKYQEWKVRFMYHNANNTWRKGLFTANDFAPYSGYYFDLVAKKTSADSMLSLTRRNATPAAIAKYRSFFDKYYGGNDGLRRYLEQEQTATNALLQTALAAYKNAVTTTLYSATAEKPIDYKGEPFYTNIVQPDDNAEAGYYICHKTILPSGKALTAGVHVTKEQGRQAFAAVLNTSEQVEWLQTLGSAGEAGMLTALSGLDYVVITHDGTMSDIVNRLYLLDFKGSIKQTANLAVGGVPRHCIYNDISQDYALTFSGGAFQTLRPTQGRIAVLMLNADFTPKWTAELPHTGYFVNTVRTNDRFYVYSAAPHNGKMQAQVNVVNPNGAVAEQETFDAGFPYYPVRISKINSDYIDMIAVKDTPDGAEAFYMIITANNKVMYYSEGLSVK